MEIIQITGQTPLYGELTVQSSKNAVLPMIAAALLAKGTTVIKKCPRITDVFHMTEIMEELGCRIRWENDTLCIDTSDSKTCRIRALSAGSMRSSVIFLGSLLGRMKEADIPYPGGCVIGKRPIDMHLAGLKKMGVVFEEGEQNLHAKAENLCGCKISLPYPSVGATQNLMLAAVLAEGTTSINGCSREPEVTQLVVFLNQMGADIVWKRPDCLVVHGVKELHAITCQAAADRIVAGTYLAAAAATRGKVVLRGAPVGQLDAVYRVLLKTGGKLRITDDTILFDGSQAVKGIEWIKTTPYPGFPTDLQSQLAAILSISDRKSHIEETVFESRFAAVEELNKMQADIKVNGRVIEICPVKKLYGARVHARDLRGGAALVIAGLAAEGDTVITGYEFLARGYADIAGDLAALGGKIQKIEVQDE